nr:HNH endonuclease [Streptomyces sp. JJ66]
MRELVLTAYECQCAFCSYDGRIGAVPGRAGAAHVRWWAFDGPAEIGNGLCLCSPHHKLSDKGVLGVAATATGSLVSQRFLGRSLRCPRAHHSPGGPSAHRPTAE